MQNRSQPRQRRRELWEPSETPAGLVGVGLMGTSIAACLLIAGHPVAAVELDPAKRRRARSTVLALLEGAKSEKLLKGDPSKVIKRLAVSGDYSALAGSRIVIESTVEHLATKRQVIGKVERAVEPETIIGSNTSAIPITKLQKGARHPERILGIHWGEP